MVEVNGTDVVRINMGGAVDRAVKLLKKLVQPAGFIDAIGHDVILAFSTRPTHCLLALEGLGDEIVPKKDTNRRWTSKCQDNQLNERQINYKVGRRSLIKVEAKIQSAL